LEDRTASFSRELESHVGKLVCLGRERFRILASAW